MNIPPIKPNEPNFGYSSVLKKAYKQGKMPTVRYDFYGSRLNSKNVTLDHVKPRSQGGKSCISNYVLATRDNNGARGDIDIRKVANKGDAIRYFYQFKDVVLSRFNGNEYIMSATKNLKKLGFDITKEINDLLKW